MVTARAEAEPNAKAVARAGAQPIVEVIERLICEHCTKDFRSRRQLQEHVQSVHLGMREMCLDNAKWSHVSGHAIQINYSLVSLGPCDISS